VRNLFRQRISYYQYDDGAKAVFAWWRGVPIAIHWITIPLVWLQEMPSLLSEASEILHVGVELPKAIQEVLKNEFGYPRVVPLDGQ
jgi:hypothetical protein